MYDSCHLHLVSAWRWPSPRGEYACVNQSADTNGRVQNTFQGNSTDSKDPELKSTDESIMGTKDAGLGSRRCAFTTDSTGRALHDPHTFPYQRLRKEGCLEHLSADSRHFIVFFE